MVAEGVLKEPTEPTLRFRTYLPRDEALRKSYEKQVDPEEIVQKVVQDVETLTKACNEKLASATGDISKLAPKKPNWDLKRDVVRKLEKLERRTQRAILEVVREKAAAEGNPANAGGNDVEGDGSKLADAVDQAGEGEDDSDLE
mmetsp:Transcript_567/g.1924  ORF Transcript_567/g.1924 Transcript_567/m.1924 type:complete len:144 (+) Transcript_567:122-553(+)